MINSKAISFSDQNQKVAVQEPYEKFERENIDYFPVIDYLTFDEKIGEGNFSQVYKGLYYQKDQVAIKLIVRGSDYLINCEIEILKKLKGAPHIVQLYEVIYCDKCGSKDGNKNSNIEYIQNKDSQNEINRADHNKNDFQIKALETHHHSGFKPSSFSKLTLLVFEYLEGIDVMNMYQTFTLDQIRILLRSLLESLSAAHDLGIVHRDVKLSNIIILHNFSEVKLIDWGCATFVNECMSSRAGSREGRPPDMLLGYHNYGFGCDVWAVGILIIFILNKGIIPWKARNSKETLIKLSEFVGGELIKDYSKKLNLEIDSKIYEDFYSKPVKTIESELIEEGWKSDLDYELLELMKSCLTIDYQLRPSAKELLDKPFFKH